MHPDTHLVTQLQSLDQRIAALEKEVIKGGAFLLQETLPISVLSPEDFTDEQRLIGQTTTEFFDKEVIPNSEKIESKDYEIQRELIARFSS